VRTGTVAGFVEACSFVMDKAYQLVGLLSNTKKGTLLIRKIEFEARQ
jgi:hypothetical protein